MNEQSPPVSLRSRTPATVKPQSPWLWLGFAKTAGIDKYRKSERYAAWWFTHCQLMNTDEKYAAECNRFHAQLICSMLLSCLLFVSLSMSYSVLPAMLLATLGSSSASYLFFAAEQRRRNDWIGRRFVAERLAPVTR